MTKKKNPLLSKTLWVNLIVAGLAFVPSVAEKLDATQVALGLGFINMVLRMVTKDKIGLEQ